MQRSFRQPDSPHRAPANGLSRSGFTIIEIMAVVIIIAILAALLLPAIGNVRRTARVAQVTADIKNLEKAIADFKLKFGMEPPSSFLISGTATDYTGSTLGKNSLAVMRQLWPNYDPSTTGLPGSLISTTGLPNPLKLDGAECLVFFLGGPGTLYDPSSINNLKSISPLGFSSNPSNPFASGGSRVGPFYEFDSSRLVDSGTADGAPELIDQLPGQTVPYQYFSSYNGRGYQINGYDTTDATDDEHTSGFTQTDAYFKSVNGTSRVYWNPKTFQIISPGFDNSFGSYSCYRDSTFYDDAGTTKQSASFEKDNITNFSSGMLIP